MVTIDGDGLVDEVGLLTLKEAAAAAHVSAEAVRLWAKRGQVTSVVHDGQLLVGERSLYDCELARRSTPGGRPRAPRQTSGD